jgi:hypothetical protein
MRALIRFGCAAAICVAATPSFAYPTGAEALEVRLLAKMGPDTRTWIASEAKREASVRVLSGETTMAAALRYGATGPGLDALAFLVLMQAERDSDSVVRGVAANDMSANASKQDARQEQMQKGMIASSQSEQMSSGEQAALKADSTPVFSLLPPNNDASAPVVNAAAAASDVADQQSGLNLQDAMDRESKIDDLVGDAMKKISAAQESVVPAMR